MNASFELPRPPDGDCRALAAAIARIAVSDGDYTTAIPGLTLHRRRTVTQPLHCIYGLGLGITAQGEKQVVVGDEVLSFGPGQSLLATVDLPVVTTVIKGSHAEPFLGLMLHLEPQDILQVLTELHVSPPARDCSFRSVAVEPLADGLLDAVLRLVQLLSDPVLLPYLAPLIRREIAYRLLTGPHGAQLRHLINQGAPSQQLVGAINWLKQHFAEPMDLEQLAASCHMSPSTFRQHFRTLTGLSPLRYQKQLRLQEARQLMLTHRLDASATAARVGYESASQFSREYARLFGEPPQRDIRRLRLN
jgi:AraC-like DNA-binding protein